MMNSMARRFGLGVSILGLTLILAAPARAVDPRDYQAGGMWMPQQIADVHADTLGKMGLRFDPKNFGDMLAFPLNAIVSLGGASASFVSPDGLCVTNHHCVRGYLQYNSREGRNLVVDGYLARSRRRELPCGPTARMYVTVAVTDVTGGVLGGLEDIADDLERQNVLEKRLKQIVKSAEAATSGTRCEVAAFYGGARYFLISRLELRDVRLVWAPHEAIGYFGGDEDNWMWPRECGDFALIRAYVGRDGKPADYSRWNVPYRPKSWFRLAGEGIEEGDLAMVIGYPGRTSRLITAYEMNRMIGWELPRQVELARKHRECLRGIAAGDEALTIKASGALFGLENNLKKREGILAAAEKIDLPRRKAEEEADLKSWIAASPRRAEEFGGVIDDINDVVREGDADREKDILFGNILGASMLLNSSVTIARMAEERAKPDLDREPGFQEREWPRIEQGMRRAQRDYAREIDQGVLELFLGEAAKLPAGGRPEIFAQIMGDGPFTAEAIHAKVAALYNKTKMADLDTRLDLLRAADMATLQKSADPMIRLALGILPVIKANQERGKRQAGAMIFLRPLYFEAMNEMNHGLIAPDANGTIRVTFGTVRGFRPAPGEPEYFPFTNVWDMAEKWALHEGKAPYDAPRSIISAVNDRRFGRYADPRLGGVPVDFMTDLDITNGNSGSPTLNARGEFTGIVFDGNIEGVGSNLVFQPDVTRAIHADARNLEWLLDAVYGAGHLLREMGVAPEFCR